MAHTVQEAQIIDKKLIEWDPDGDDIVWIRQARMREEALRDRMFAEAKVRRNVEAGTVDEIYQLPGADIIIAECAMTLVDSSLQKEVKKKLPDGTEVIEKIKIFKPDMSQATIREAIIGLDPKLVLEWHRYVREVNPHWDPNWSGEAKN